MHEVRRLIPTIREIFMKRSNRVARTSCASQIFVTTSEIATRYSFLRAVLTIRDSPWVKIIKITIIIVFALISFLVFSREAFGSVKTTNFVSKNSARIENFMS